MYLHYKIQTNQLKKLLFNINNTQIIKLNITTIKKKSSKHQNIKNKTSIRLNTPLLNTHSNYSIKY